MKLKEYIMNVIKECDINNLEIGITFDIGVTTDMEVNESSLNRIKFSCRRKP